MSYRLTGPKSTVHTGNIHITIICRAFTFHRNSKICTMHAVTLLMQFGTPLFLLFAFISLGLQLSSLLFGWWCVLISWPKEHSSMMKALLKYIFIQYWVINPNFSFLLLMQRHRKDVANFDKQFTSEKPDMTPTDKLFMMNLDQNEFAGFSFLNPEYIQHV